MIKSLGRNADSILKNLKALNVTLEELQGDIEFIIEEFSEKQKSWDRFNQLKDIPWDIDCWIYYKGQLVTTKQH